MIYKCRLVNVVVRVMGDVFPELKLNEEHIRETIAAEEASFGKTLLKVHLIFNIPWVLLLITRNNFVYVDYDLCLFSN